MAFTKGVHRIIIDTKKELSSNYISALYAKDDGEWETAIFIDGDLKTNTITYLLANVLQNKVFNCDESICNSLRVTNQDTQRAALSLPNFDGTAGMYGILFGSSASNKNIYNEVITDNVRTKIGTIQSNVFSDSNPNFHSGMQIITNNQADMNNSDYGALSYPLLMTVDVQDDFYSIGFSCYFNVSNLNSAKGSFIQTNIFVGKTNINNNYLMYYLGYNSNPPVRAFDDPPFGVIITDNSSIIFDDPVYIEQPYTTLGGIAKLNKLVIANNDLGWYYGSTKYSSIIAEYNKVPSTSGTRALYVNTYNFNRLIENAITLDNKSFDAYVGKSYYAVILFREHK